MQTFTFKRSAAALMAAAFISPVAFADVGGGGATLPAKAYIGPSASSTATGNRLSTTFDAGGLFAEALPGVGQSYCQTGSGGGRSVITGSSGNTDATRACPTTFNDSFVNGTNGFSAPSNDADYAGSDQPAGTGDFNSFLANKGIHGQLTQFPSIAGLIAVYVNAPGNNAQTLYFTEAELCNIWAGKITNWNQLATTTGAPFGNKAIRLVYRSDGSGTSFSFSNHLNRVCQDPALAQTLTPAASALPLTGANNFTVQNSFSAAFPGGIPPAGSIAASGNPAVASTVSATEASIGYVEAANAIALPSATARVARIAPVDPALELNPNDGVPTARTINRYRSPAVHNAIFPIPSTFVDVDGLTYSGTYTDRALQANGAFGRPVGVPTALTAVQAPNANCVYIVHPGAYATSGYVTPGSPVSGYAAYPIVAVTYLLGNYAVNANPGDVEKLLRSPYDTTLRATSGGPVTSIGANTGFSYLSLLRGTPLSSVGTVTLSLARVNACVN